MRRREFITLLGGTAAWPNSVAAQSRARRALVAMLVGGTSDGYSASVQAFRHGLQKLGYIEGRDLDIVDRYSDGDPTRLPALVVELVKLKPDVIVTTSTSAALAAKQATTAVPIISAILTDPIGNGLAASEARPGSNVTGIEFTLKGLTGKRLELAREVIPQTSSVGLLVNMKSASNPPQRRDVEAAANAGHQGCDDRCWSGGSDRHGVSSICPRAGRLGRSPWGLTVPQQARANCGISNIIATTDDFC